MLADVKPLVEAAASSLGLVDTNQITVAEAKQLISEVLLQVFNDGSTISDLLKAMHEEHRWNAGLYGG